MIYDKRQEILIKKRVRPCSTIYDKKYEVFLDVNHAIFSKAIIVLIHFAFGTQLTASGEWNFFINISCRSLLLLSWYKNINKFLKKSLKIERNTIE